MIHTIYVIARTRWVRIFGVLVSAWVFFGCMDEDRAPSVGADAPDFAVSPLGDLSKHVALKDLRGKVVIVDFWATWCGPCKSAMDHLQKLYRADKAQGLEMMAITNEDPATVNPFVVATNLEVPCYIDASNQANNTYKVTGLPTTLVIGKNGRILLFEVGTNSDVETEIDQTVASALAAPG